MGSPGSRFRRAVASVIWLFSVLLAAGTFYAYFVANVRFASDVNPTVLEDVTAVLTGLAPLAFATVGWLIAIRRRDNLVAWLFLVGALVWACAQIAGHYSYLTVRGGGYVEIAGKRLPSAADWLNWFPTWTFALAFALLGIFVLLIFPDGRLPSRRWRPAATFVVFSIAAFCLRRAFGPQKVTLSEFEIPPLRSLGYGISFFGRAEEIVNVLLALAGVVAAAAVVARYRHSKGETRQQLKWFAFPAILLALAHTLDYVLHFAGQRTEVWIGILGLVFWTLTTFVAVGTAIAILKYRLYEIDVVVNRTLTYGLLALFITVAYVGLSVGVSMAVTDRTASTTTSVMAMGLVAVSFAPVRAGTQKFANRIVFGDRAKSHELLTRFSQDAGTTLRIEELLPKVAQLAARGIGAASVVVRLSLEGAADRAEVWPPGATLLGPPDLLVDIAYADEQIGGLEVRLRRGEGASSEDRRFLTLLATHAGAAFQNAKLTFELDERLQQLIDAKTKLEESSRRLVTTQLFVRRALKAEIDTRVGPHLSLATTGLIDAERAILAQEPRVSQLLDRASATIDAALEELRDIAHGVFSPMIEEKGLVSALESRIAKTRTNVNLNVDESVRKRRFGSATENAVYFSCVALLKLVSSPVEIRIYLSDDDLIFKVRIDSRDDDPFIQLDPDWIQSLGDRLGATGGRIDLIYSSADPIVVMGRVPVPVSEAATA